MHLKYKYKNFIVIPATSLMVVALSPAVFGYSSYQTDWDKRYPDSLSAQNAAAASRDCTICHDANDRSLLNIYAWDYMQNGMSLEAIEQLDSDGDGYTNLEEIDFDTQPGWVSGNNNDIYTGKGLQSQNQAAPSGIAGDLDPVIGNQAPTANAGGPYVGTQDILLTFDASKSRDTDGSISTYEWDFGDGNIENGAVVEHSFAEVGRFNVMLTVTDDAGETDTVTTTATIGASNIAPTATINGTYAGIIGRELLFDGEASKDSDGSIVSYLWDFGDGSTGNGSSVSHSYDSAGIFNVSLTVTDDHGATDSTNTQAQIVELNQAPIANTGGPYSGLVDAEIVFDGTASSDTDGEINAYRWDFGDGNTSTLATPTHTYTSDGTYQVTLQVTDNDGETDSGVTTAVISALENISPTAITKETYSATVGAAIDFDASESMDADGTIVSYGWDFGDGSTAEGETATHTYYEAGKFNVTLTVIDNDDAIGVATSRVIIGLGNQAPVAAIDSPNSSLAGEAVAFNGSDSTDDMGIATYHWDFGDGSSAEGEIINHSYDIAGIYHVTLTVADDAGVEDSASATVTVTDADVDNDLSLIELEAPAAKTIEVNDGKSLAITATAQGGSNGQQIRVSLALANQQEGILVGIPEKTVVEYIEGNDDMPVFFDFDVNVSCEVAGDYNLQWFALMEADPESEGGVTTLSAETLVTCTDTDTDTDDSTDSKKHKKKGKHSKKNRDHREHEK